MNTEGHVFIACSQDGFIARPDGDIGWLHQLPDIGSDYGYADFMAGMDGLVMGRATFEKVLSFGEWPYKKPVVVVSRSLNALPESVSGKVSISRDSPADLMARLGREGWQRAYIDGGKLVSSFLQAGLVSSLTLSRIPILLGTGLPLFSGLARDIRLQHVSTEAYASGLVQSRFKVLREED
ncbi:dihydrofolate reductase family protein [Hyphomonas sp.]|uniref:dihydrofolate reductase family protein n=1 Tax=Hyphomonas sp. TaxID=87 RepID=UPI00391D5FC7